MEFNFLKLVFTLTLAEDIDDPYLLFGIRTDFAKIFRRATGCDRAGCVKCLQTADCSYHQIFSQAMHSDPSAIKRFQKPPLPFVFDPPLLPPVPNRGSGCEIGLTLVGLAVNHVLHFLDAVGFMFGHQESRWTEVANVVKIESLDYLGNRAIISQNGGKAALDRFFILSMDGLEKSAFLPTDKVSLTFATPLRIIKDGRPLRELSFSALAMSLIRRISSIAFYLLLHGAGSGLQMAVKAKSGDRHQQQRVQMGRMGQRDERDHRRRDLYGSHGRVPSLSALG